MKQQFTAVYKKSGKWYIGWIEEFPGVNSQGKTISELKDNLKEALRLIIETNRILSENEIGKGVRRELIAISA